MKGPGRCFLIYRVWKSNPSGSHWLASDLPRRFALADHAMSLRVHSVLWPHDLSWFYNQLIYRKPFLADIPQPPHQRCRQFWWTAEAFWNTRTAIIATRQKAKGSKSAFLCFLFRLQPRSVFFTAMSLNSSNFVQVRLRHLVNMFHIEDIIVHQAMCFFSIFSFLHFNETQDWTGRKMGWDLGLGETFSFGG